MLCSSRVCNLFLMRVLSVWNDKVPGSGEQWVYDGESVERKRVACVCVD